MVPSAVPANGLKPESEGAFNSEATFFVARKKKKHTFYLGKRKRDEWNERFRAGLKITL